MCIAHSAYTQYSGPLIACISLGETRVLSLRKKSCGGNFGEAHTLVVDPGSLYLQAGRTCVNYEHAILAGDAHSLKNGGRISILLRIKPDMPLGQSLVELY